jgi:membrane protease YdiL (CAAX protease family)
VDLVDRAVRVEADGKLRPIDSTVVQFFLLTYAITWVCSAIGLSGTASSSRLFSMSRTLLLLVGSLAPSVAAFGLTAWEDGISGLRSLLGHLLDWQVSVRWYFFAVFYAVSILLIPDAAHRVIAGTWLPLSHLRWIAIISSTALYLPIRASEEIGWRGYAIPLLAKKFGLGRASLILGPIWAGWHLPLFFIPGARVYAQSIPVYVLEVTALSVAFAWLYGNTNGSLLPVIVMHSALDEALAFLPSPGIASNPLDFNGELIVWLIVAVAWLMAAWFLVRMPQLPSHETEPLVVVQH